jgi:hypothetical protein
MRSCRLRLTLARLNMPSIGTSRPGCPHRLPKIKRLEITSGKSVYYEYRCGRGGTGRRARLRILWPKGLGGSSPSARTIFDPIHRFAGRGRPLQRRVNLAIFPVSPSLPNYSFFLLRQQHTSKRTATLEINRPRHVSIYISGMRDILGNGVPRTSANVWRYFFGPKIPDIQGWHSVNILHSASYKLPNK